MEFGFASVSGITVICLLAGLAWKKCPPLNNKWIPCICGLIGGILGVVAFLTQVPDFPATDFLNAAAVGIVSGFSATGIHQISKQLIESESSED